MWILWARSSVATKICIFRTTMLMEFHWKVVKRDYLPKFFQSRLDLVTYIIISRLIPHHQQQFNKYQQKREIHLVHQSQFKIDSQFFRCIQRQGYYPFLTFNTNSSESIYDISKKDNILKDITTILPITIQKVYNIIRDITNYDAENGPILFKEIKLLLNDLREIVDEQESLENYQWIQAVNNGFNGVRKIVNDVKTYRKRITNPRTWKDHNINTMFLESINIQSILFK
ncbi:unnamed protein product [Rhizophagus irregularis]|nr:unnamed protein product [Rhizophagus irregularis]